MENVKIEQKISDLVKTTHSIIDTYDIIDSEYDFQEDGIYEWYLKDKIYGILRGNRNMFDEAFHISSYENIRNTLINTMYIYVKDFDNFVISDCVDKIYNYVYFAIRTKSKKMIDEQIINLLIKECVLDYRELTSAAIKKIF